MESQRSSSQIKGLSLPARSMSTTSKGLGKPGYPWMEKAGQRTMRTSNGSLGPSNTTSSIASCLKTGSNSLNSVNSLSTSTTVNVLTQALAECRHYRNTS